MNELKITGGARIGKKRASWPFVTLKASRDMLALDAGMLGKFAFLPGDISSTDPYSLPGLGKDGLRIYHNVPGYDDMIIFQSLKLSGQEIERMIAATGFADKDGSRNLNMGQREKEVRQLQASGGFPIKKPFAIAFVVLWNVLFIGGLLFGFLNNDQAQNFIPLAALPAIGFVALTALLLLVSDGFARLVLKEGREAKDLRKFLFFLLFIAAFIMVNMYIIVNATS